jgi:hypothetical protein
MIQTTNHNPQPKPMSKESYISPDNNQYYPPSRLTGPGIGIRSSGGMPNRTLTT